MLKRTQYYILILTLVSLGSVVFPRLAMGQLDLSYSCCYHEPGRCELSEPESGLFPTDVGGTIVLQDCTGNKRPGPCNSYPDCTGRTDYFNSSVPAVRCCVCSPEAGGDLGTCAPPANQEGNICGTTMSCRQSNYDCSDQKSNPECTKWDKTLEEVKKIKSLYFTLNLSIPGSSIFNAGQNIELTGQTIGEYIAALYVFFVGIAGILATIMMMFGGFIYVTAFGNPQKISQAKDTITSALLGLALSLGAYVILLTINPNLVQFTGLTSLKSVGMILQGQESNMVPEKGPAPGLEPQYLNPTLKIPNNVSTWDQLITTVAGQYRDWAKVIMLMESSGRPGLVSDKGACGLMQLLPTTANLTCEQLKDPETNVRAGVRYFLEMLNGGACPKETYKHPCHWGPVCIPGVMSFVLASYNGGPGANWCSVDCKSTIWQCPTNKKGYQQTVNYVSKGNALYEKIHNNEAGYEWTVPAP